LGTKAERGDPDSSSQNRRKLHSSLQASIAGDPGGVGSVLMLR
jgi:hypothetical protein